MAKRKKEKKLNTYEFSGELTITGSVSIEAYSLEEAEAIAESADVFTHLDRDKFLSRGSWSDWDFSYDGVSDDEDDE